MNWNKIESQDQLEAALEKSKENPVVIFKHSTRCSISAVALNRLERQWDDSAEKVSPYYLDLIRYRSISDEIAQKLEIPHESPQMLIIQDGKCIDESSHFSISFDTIKEVSRSLSV